MSKKDEVEVQIRLEPEIEKLVREGAARAGVAPEELLRSIMIAELANPEKSKTPISDMLAISQKIRVQEYTLQGLLHALDKMLEEITDTENRLKHYSHKPEWSGKEIMLKGSQTMQAIARMLPTICTALDELEWLGPGSEFKIDVRSREVK